MELKFESTTTHSVLNRTIACVLIATLPSVALAGNQVSAPPSDGDAAAQSADSMAWKRPRLLTVVSPRPQDSFVSDRLAMTLRISRSAYRRSLLIKLNGKDVTPLFQSTGSCDDANCTESARLTLRAGLRTGKNKVRIRIDSRRPWVIPDLQDFEFNWQPSSPSSGLTDSAISLSPALAFTTVSNGGQYGTNPWFQIYSNALNGGTMSYPSETPCTGVYQIVTLNRQTLQQDSYVCYPDDASFATALANLNSTDPTAKPDLVVAGTTWYNSAGPKLNTTTIGGTDYSKYASADLPLGYMIIGVPGAAAGTAYETYYVSSNDNSVGGYNPRINGILSVDANSNYNFFGYDAVPYSVDATAGTITVNGSTYTPPTTVQNGLWLLQLDRWSLNSQPLCPSSGNSVTNCGQVFDTGSLDAQTAAQAMSDLNTALSTASHKNLLLLTTIGSSPFAAPPDGNFALTIETLGIPANTFNAVARGTVAGAKMTLISSSDPAFTKSMIGGNAIVSSSSYVQQGQTGSVYGELARDQHSFYRPISGTQGTIASATLPNLFAMYQIPWSQPAPWDSLKTASMQAAYRYLSYTLILAATNNNRKSDDIHSLYVSSLNGLLVKNNQYPDPTAVPMPATIPWNDPIDGVDYTFTQADLTAVEGLVKTELGNLNQGINFVNQVTPYINNTSGSYVLEIVNAATNALNELNVPTSTPASLNMSNVANFAGALASLASLGLGELDGPIMSAMSGLLWAAGSAQIITPGSNAIPNPYQNLTIELENVTKEAATLADNTAVVWGTIQDNVFSDQTKLTNFAYNADNTWAAKDQSQYTRVGQAFTNSANVSFFTQLFGSINKVDFYGAYPYPITNPSQIYTWGDPGCYEGQCMYSCIDVYGSSIATGGWNSWPSIPNAASTDFYVIGGPIKGNGFSNASETMPKQDSIETLFGTAPGQFNLPQDLFYSINGPLQRRTGTDNLNFGYTFCGNKNDNTFYPKPR